MTLLVGLYPSYFLEWVLEPPSSSSHLPPLKRWMITVAYCSRETFSIYFSKTTRPTMMYTISSMATSTTSRSHSSSCGTESWVPTCHTRWRRGKVVVLKLNLAKITRMISFLAWWAFFICTSIVFPCYEQPALPKWSCYACIYIWCVLFYIFIFVSPMSILDRHNKGNWVAIATYYHLIFTLVLLAATLIVIPCIPHVLPCLTCLPMQSLIS